MPEYVERAAAVVRVVKDPRGQHITIPVEKRVLLLIFKRLNGIGDTKANLRAGIEGEHYETTEMYPASPGRRMQRAGADVAALFRRIARVEAEHDAPLETYFHEKNLQSLLKIAKSEAQTHGRRRISPSDIDAAWSRLHKREESYEV